jgi:hypothetical protein
LATWAGLSEAGLAIPTQEKMTESKKEEIRLKKDVVGFDQEILLVTERKGFMRRLPERV